MKNWIGMSVIGMLYIGGICPESCGEEESRSHHQGLSAEDQHALEVGRKVVQVRAALKNPEGPEALKAVQSLGLDSRYYVMVRGWIVQEIQMAKSFRDVGTYSTSETYKKKVEDRITALSGFLRRIDLE